MAARAPRKPNRALQDRALPAPSLRERLQDATRDLIVDALIDLIEEEGPFAFSFFALARRAGVSVRTIYRYFATREALFDAVSQRVNERVGFREYPRDREGIVALIRELFPAFDREAKLIRTQIKTSLGRQVRTHAQRARAHAVLSAVDVIAPDLDPERRRLHAAAIHCLMNADSWQRLNSVFDMDGVRAGETIASAVTTLFDAIEAENARERRKREE